MATCACCRGHKDYQERLRYHAERFSSKGSCLAVLQRYEGRLELAEEAELMRLTFHVASWGCAATDLASVQLLLRFLQRVKHCSTSPCEGLLRLLKLLSGRAKERLDTPWLQLSMLLEEILPRPGSSGMPSKGVRLLQSLGFALRNSDMVP